jgi:hypothetical protein
MLHFYSSMTIATSSGPVCFDFKSITLASFVNYTNIGGVCVINAPDGQFFSDGESRCLSCYPGYYTDLTGGGIQNCLPCKFFVVSRVYGFRFWHKFVNKKIVCCLLRIPLLYFYVCFVLCTIFQVLPEIAMNVVLPFQPNASNALKGFL